jgi:hypothetical protein
MAGLFGTFFFFSFGGAGGPDRDANVNHFGLHEFSVRA